VPEEVTTPSLAEPSVQWGPNLVLIKDHMAICGGIYGAKKNNCFCCAPLMSSRSCPARHAIAKHPLLLDDATLASSRVYFHKGSTVQAVYAEPFVEVGGLSTGEVTQLLSKVVVSWEAWREEALLITAARRASCDEALLRTAVKATKTLPRWGRSQGDDTLDDWKEDVKGQAAKIEQMIESLKEVEWAEDSDTKGNLDKLWKRMLFLQNAVKELGESSRNNFRDFQLGFGIRIAEIEAIIGSASTVVNGTQQEGCSIFRMLDDLQEQITGLAESNLVEKITHKVFRSPDMLKQTTGVKEAFRAVMQCIMNVERTVKDLHEVRQGKREDGSVGSSTAAWLGMDVDEPELPFQHAKQSAKESSVRNLNGDGELKDVIQSLAERVNGLEQTVVPGFKVEGEDISIAFMGIRFSSEEDVRSYVESLCDGRFEVTPGLVTDCYSIFHALNREIFETKNKLSVVDLHKVTSLGMLQSDLYNILAGVEHGLPDFFDSPAAAGKIYIDGKQGKKHRFSNIASYEVWGPVGTIKDAVRKRAETHLTRIVRNRRQEIRNVKHPDLRAFLTAMLDLSKDFVEAVFSFLTEEYSALSEHFNDGALCWDFACSCVEHVFKYEFEAARAVVINPDVADTAVRPKILWQSLRTIAVQESFMRVGFKNHSSLSSAYSRFLLTQYQQTALELNKVSKEAEGYKKQFAEMKTAMEALDKRLKAAEGTANAAQNAVQKMKKHND
jgi:hypothetical protein